MITMVTLIRTEVRNSRETVARMMTLTTCSRYSVVQPLSVITQISVLSSLRLLAVSPADISPVSPLSPRQRSVSY